MNQFLRDILERSSGSVKVKSQAMAPLMWLCGPLVTVGVAGLLYGPPSFAWFFVALIVFAVLLYTGFYTYWAVTDPDRLGSEAFVERSHMIRILEQSKDPDFLSTAAPTQIVPDPNPPTTRALKP